ncbi:GntR family transcriptional regulator [Streptomyces sp. NPDC048342]|uniref:FadR/GntR family transcriptional regulator n=1 Tax=unclassified Streptomyces TaxID=2593676 RepID=UPI003414E4CE
MPLNFPRRSALVDQVITQLKNQITSGEWPVGQRIPTEPQLVELLGVARNTVREAVRALAHNGMVDIRQGSGTYVIATSELAGMMRRRFASTDLLHAAQLCRALETSAALLAAEQRTERDLAQLDALLARRERDKAVGDLRQREATVTSLRRAVVTASHNDVLIELYADLGDLVVYWLRMATSSEALSIRHPDYAELVEAIRRGDGAAAALQAAARPLPAGTSHGS